MESVRFYSFVQVSSTKPNRIDLLSARSSSSDRNWSDERSCFLSSDDGVFGVQEPTGQEAIDFFSSVVGIGRANGDDVEDSAGSVGKIFPFLCHIWSIDEKRIHKKSASRKCWVLKPIF